MKISKLTSTVALTGNVTLNPSPNFIGLATVVPGATPFPVTDNSGSLTVDWLSGATVNLSNATLYAFFQHHHVVLLIMILYL